MPFGTNLPGRSSLRGSTSRPAVLLRTVKLADALLRSLELRLSPAKLFDGILHLGGVAEEQPVLLGLQALHAPAQRLVLRAKIRLRELEERRAGLHHIAVAGEDLEHEAFVFGPHLRLLGRPHHALNDERAGERTPTIRAARTAPAADVMSAARRRGPPSGSAAISERTAIHAGRTTINMSIRNAASHPSHCDFSPSQSAKASASARR